MIALPLFQRTHAHDGDHLIAAELPIATDGVQRSFGIVHPAFATGIGDGDVGGHFHHNTTEPRMNLRRRALASSDLRAMRLIRARTLFFLLLVALSAAVAAKGRGWSYHLTGVAYDQTTKDVLRNTQLMIGKQLVTTDSTGHYRVTISGVTCDRGNAVSQALQRRGLRRARHTADAGRGEHHHQEPLEAVRFLRRRHHTVQRAAA